MGNCGSIWSNKNAASYAAACVRLFGKPDIFVNKKGGAVIWKSSLKMRTLFGKRIAFSKIMIVDENVHHDLLGVHDDFLHCWVPLSVDAMKRCDIESVCDMCMYDNIRKCLILRCNSLENIIAGLYVCTQLLTMKMDPAMAKAAKLYEVSLATVAGASGDPAKMAKVRDMYMKCLDNLATLTGKEHLVGDSDPWYSLPGQGEPHASNYAQDIDAVDRDDQKYYNDLDRWMKTKSSQTLFPQIMDLPTSSNQFSGEPAYLDDASAHGGEKLINFPRYEPASKTEHYSDVPADDTLRSVFHTSPNPNPMFGREHLSFPKVSVAAIFKKPGEPLANYGTTMFIGPTTTEHGQPAGANNQYANYGPVIGDVFGYHDRRLMAEHLYDGAPPVLPIVNDGKMRYLYTPKFSVWGKEKYSNLLPVLAQVDAKKKR